MVIWFGVVVFALFLLPCLLYRKPKKIIEEPTLKTSTLVRIGIWRSLNISLMMLLYPEVPNYEMIHRTSREYSVSEFGMVDIPTCKEGLLFVVSLSVAKKIMSSMRWVDRFRHNYYLYNVTWNKPYGLLLGSGEYWRESRSLTLRLLHKLEFFKQENMERMIRTELCEILEKIDQIIKDGGGVEGTFRPHQMFEVNALNLVSQVCWSERYRETDPFVTTVVHAMNRANRSFNAGFGILELFPWIARIFPRLTYYGDLKEASDVAVAYFQNVLKRRRQAGTYQTDPRDFTDYFLQEIDLHKSPKIINDKAYYVTMRDLVWAGTDTTNSTLEHALLHLALRPQVQQRVQAEIDQVLGRSDLPCYADRTRTPYTQAVILEILRYGIPVPLTSRSNTDDSLIGDTEIPKGSLCALNIYSVHRSSDIWEDPDEFRPDRFLNADGKIINTEKIIPFGYGKRVCIGEPLARTFLFITLVSLLQRYEFQLSKHHAPPSMENIPGMSRCPVPYYVTVKGRN